MKKSDIILEFVKTQHEGQVRKYTGEPYWNHLKSVGDIVSSVANIDWMICIGYCHDLFEDTKCTEAMLYEELINVGYHNDLALKIVDGVNSLTDVFTKEAYPDQNRTWRKSKEAERLWNIDWCFQTIKYADLLDNTSSIVANDPSFAKVYLQEKREILKGMRHGSSILLEKLELSLNNFRKND